MTDHRASRRYQTYQTAHVVLEGGNRLIKCWIRDISETGAALEFPGETPLPKFFPLLFEKASVERVIGGVWGEQKRMVVPTCEAVWTKGNRVGVKFR